MKNRNYLAIAALAGLSLGGLSVTAAAAQSYGSQDSDSADTAEATNAEVETSDAGSIVLIQDETTPDDEADGNADGEGRRRGGCKLETAAAAIGIDEADLRAALEDGDTIADVAEANGVSVDSVVDAMVDAKTERIAEKVAEGRITQEEADEKLADLESRITDRVNGVEDAPEA